jgi:hypothetical protein
LNFVKATYGEDKVASFVGNVGDVLKIVYKT